jgi:hypothetical protein
MGTAGRMVFGHNTNVTLGTIVYHVQTEDRGASHALIDTTVYYRGRVLHRRTNSYFDLLPLEMRAGVLQLSIPRALGPAGEAAAIPPEPPAMAEVRRKLRVQLTNAKSWLTGKRASLQVSVNEENGEPVAGAKVEAQIEGSAEPLVYAAEAGESGQAQIEFEMPKIGGGEVALAIRAVKQDGEGHLRFALRAKPKVPTV